MLKKKIQKNQHKETSSVIFALRPNSRGTGFAEGHKLSTYAALLSKNTSHPVLALYQHPDFSVANIARKYFSMERKFCSQ